MKIFIFFIVLLILALAGAPFATGYYFKDVYIDQINFLQTQMQNSDVTIKVVSYETGWLQSTAEVSVTYQAKSHHHSFPMPPLVFTIKSIIHHGPLIKANGQWQSGYALIESSLHLPALMSTYFPDTAEGFMHVDTAVSFNKRFWQSHYRMQPVSFPGFVDWEGMQGDFNLGIINHLPVKIYSDMVFGQINVPQTRYGTPGVHQEEIKLILETDMSHPNAWEGSSNIKTNGTKVTWEDGRIFAINNFAQSSSYAASDNLYNDHEKINIAEMQIPKPSLITFIKDLAIEADFKNFSVEGYNKISDQPKDPADNMRYRLYRDRMKNNNLYLLLTPSTTVDINTSFATNAGNGSVKLNVSLLGLPKNDEEITDNINAALNLKFSQQLVTTLIQQVLILQQQDQEERNKYSARRQQFQAGIPNPNAPLPSMAAAPAPVPEKIDPVQKAQEIISKLLEQGYFAADQTDYIAAVSIKGKAITLNGKDISDSAEFMKNLNLIFFGPKYSCYWLSNNPADNGKWTQGISADTIEDCYALDSCNGGLKQSGGGCYKWALSPEDTGVPWPNANPPTSTAPAGSTTPPGTIVNQPAPIPIQHY